MASRKEIIQKVLDNAPLKITTRYPESQQITNRAAMLRNAQGYFAVYSISVHAFNDEEAFAQLKEDLKNSHVEVQVRPFKDCPDGNVIF